MNDTSVVRLAAVAALATLCGCRQLLGFEEPSSATSDGTAATPDAPVNPTDGPGIDPDATDPMVDAFDTATCPASYGLASGNSRYRNITTTSPNWDTAANDCGDDGATTHLVVLNDDLERAVIINFAGGIAKWVGLSDRKTVGTLLWVTDQASSYPPASGSPWGAGEPSGSGCVELTPGGTFEMSACGQNFAAICECDGFSNDPTNY